MKKKVTKTIPIGKKPDTGGPSAILELIASLENSMAVVRERDRQVLMVEAIRSATTVLTDLSDKAPDPAIASAGNFLNRVYDALMPPEATTSNDCVSEPKEETEGGDVA